MRACAATSAVSATAPSPATPPSNATYAHTQVGRSGRQVDQGFWEPVSGFTSNSKVEVPGGIGLQPFFAQGLGMGGSWGLP